MDTTQSSTLGFTEQGEDSDGTKYATLEEMWRTELKEDGTWYKKGEKYWENVDSTVNGMLGGFETISKEDIKASKEFLKEFLDAKFGFALAKGTAIDCGAGIGRITKNFLSEIFQHVDLLEQNQGFLDKAKEELGSNPKVRDYLCSGMQSFNFEDRKYDLIWVQWVTGHLTDADFISFLQRCQKALTKNGLLVIKENNTREGFIVDKQDSSVTRSDKHLRTLFTKAGLEIVKVKLQPKFPKELFPVRMYALR